VHRIHVDQESKIQLCCVKMLVSRYFFCSIYFFYRKTEKTSDRNLLFSLLIMLHDYFMIFVDVQVRMVTGDNVQTARAIALECGILSSDADLSEPTLIEGKSFREMTDAERDKISDKISVLFSTLLS